MSRREEREQAFALLFERLLHREPMEELIDGAGLARDFVLGEFTKQIVFGVEEQEEKINQMIEAHTTGWKFNRLSKVTVALLQLAIFEIEYLPDIPHKVSINEAVELAKQYGGKEDAPFINGVLGSIVKDREQANG